MRVSDAECALVEAPEHEWSECDRPDPIVDFLEGDVLFGQHVADVHPVIVPPDAAVATHPAHFAVRGILERGESRRVRTRGRRVPTDRRRLRQRLMGTLQIVLSAERIKAALLGTSVLLGRFRRLSFQGAVQAFVASVLLRRARAR